MNRSQSLDRQYRRILYAGLGLSAVAHAAALALRFNAAPLPQQAAVLALQPPIEEIAAPEERTELIQIASAPAAPSPASDAMAATSSASSASAAARPSIQDGAGAPAPSAAVADVAFEKMPVIDPLSQGEISPVVFTDLPVAAAEEIGDGEADVPVYVPGSIGRAKRKWAGGNGGSLVSGGKGAFVIVGGGGGHCPMPGRVPPVWK